MAHLFRTNVYLIIVIISGSITEIVKNADVGNYSYLTYFISIVNSTTWFLYGYTLDNYTIMTTNLPGSYLGVIFCFCYALYAKDRRYIMKVNIIFVLFWLLLCILYFFASSSFVSLFYGICSNIGTISIYSAPIIKIVYIFLI